MGRELLTYVAMIGVVVATISSANSFKCEQYLTTTSYMSRELKEDCLSCMRFYMHNENLKGLSCETDEVLITDNLFKFFERKYGKYKAFRILQIPPTNFMTSCSQTPTIIKLTMSKISLQTISPFFFCPLVNLFQIDLSYNLITSLNSSFFIHIKKLQTLDLSHNNISTLNDPFSMLRDLFEINLSYNKIRYISDNLFQNQTFLTNLSLSNNQISKFDYSFQHSFHYPIDSVDISFNRITSFKLVGLVKKLSISNNLLKTLLVNFTLVTESIDLSSNQLIDFGEYSILNATDLRYLNLGNNNLSSLPTSSFRNLQHLEILNISNNLLGKSKFGPNDNWISFFLFFENLKVTSLNNNLWICNDLKEIYFILKSKAVYVDSGEEHMRPNIHGIACTPTHDNGLINGSLTSFEVNSDIVSELMKEIWKRLENITKFQDLETNVENQINQSQSAILSKIDDLESKVNKYNLSINSFQQIVSKIVSQMIELEGKTIYNGSSLEVDKNAEEYREIRKKLELLKTTLDLQNTEKEKLKNNEVLDKETYNNVAKLLLKSINAGSKSVAGEIIENILLVVIIFALCCIIYNIYMLKRNKITLREELNLM